MQIVVLIAFTIALSVRSLADRPAAWWVLAACGAGYLAVTALLARFRVRAVARAAAGDMPRRWARRIGALEMVSRAWLVGGLGGLMLLGLGEWVYERAGLGYVPLVGTLAAVTPFVAALAVHWLIDYRAYRLLRETTARRPDAEVPSGRTWTRWEYLEYNVRHHVLFIAVPLSLIVAINDALWMYVPPLAGQGSAVFGALAVASLVSAVGVFLVAPAMIVRVWRTGPLPPDALRDRLEAMCRRLGLRYRRILVWRSGGVIANAAVMGFIAPMRYMLLSDGLLEQMPDEQIEAVFAHEAGHVAERHVPYAAMFAISSVTLCALAGEGLAALTGGGEWAANGLTIAMLLPAWGWGFGWISRRFERQSDAIGAWEAGHPAGGDERISPEGASVFARALQRVAQLNGTPVHRKNWRHGSIEWRISYILWLASTGGTRRGIDRLVRRIKIGLWIALVLAVLGVAAQTVFGDAGAAGPPPAATQPAASEDAT